jgi:hypothetical protein
MNVNLPIITSFKKLPLFILFCLFPFLQSISQTSSIRGKITDATTGEALIGANVLIQGTITGGTSDVDGNFVIKELEKGVYNLVISYVSYEQQILRIEVDKNEPFVLDVKLASSSVTLGEVKVVANKRSDTEMAMINTLKNGSLSVNGISRQQISRSLDKDASEVITRVPGVTVRDGKFINVRGLDERYNVVMLNGVGVPSSEADRRAFSFDMLPSSLIDNLILYKTPAPELPADFAGAVVQIQTKIRSMQIVQKFPIALDIGPAQPIVIFILTRAENTIGWALMTEPVRFHPVFHPLLNSGSYRTDQHRKTRHKLRK